MERGKEMKTKSYTISYGGRLPGKENHTETQYACSFKITPVDPPGQEFYFDIPLQGGVVFRGWAKGCGLKEEDWEEYAELAALYCGIEETISKLNRGIGQDGHPIPPLIVNCPREDLERKKVELQEFRDKRKTISHTVTVKKPNR